MKDGIQDICESPFAPVQDCLPTLMSFLYSQIFSVETGTRTEAGMQDKINMQTEK